MGYNLKTIELFLQFTLELGISTPFRCEFEREVLFDLRGPAELKLKPAIFRLLEYQYKTEFVNLFTEPLIFFSCPLVLCQVTSMLIILTFISSGIFTVTWCLCKLSSGFEI